MRLILRPALLMSASFTARHKLLLFINMADGYDRSGLIIPDNGEARYRMRSA